MMDPVPFVTNDDAAAAYYDDKNQLHHCSGGSKGDIWSDQRHQRQREGAQRHAEAAEA